MYLTWERLAAGVHRCRLAFCDVSVGLVCGRSGALLVDAGTTLAEAEAIRADAERLAGGPVTHLVLTHKHFDHVLGTPAFAGAEVYCAPEVSDYLSTATGPLRDDALRHGADSAEIDRAIAALRAPRRGVHEAVIDLGGPVATITHPGRGHTASDLIVVVTGADDGRVVVFTGDLVEESGDPVADADSDLAAWPATLDRVLALGGPDAVYVPGHGRAVDADFVRRQRDWLLAAARAAGGDEGVGVGDADP